MKKILVGLVSLYLTGCSVVGPGEKGIRALEKWDGKLPTLMGSGGTVPFINIKAGGN